MNLVKSIKKGNYELRHSSYVNFAGILSNFMEIVKTGADGRKLHAPFIAPVRITDEPSFHEDTRPYSDEEYDEMFETNVKRLKEETN